MKNLKFLAMAMVAVLTLGLTACGGEDPTKPEPEKKAPFSVKFGGKELKANEEVVISEYEVDFFTQLVFSPVIVNNVDDFVNISITEERVDFDPAVYQTQMCIEQCMTSDGQKTQDWGSFELAPEAEKQCDAHFVIAEDKKAEAIKATVKYTFSDGKTTIPVTVKYDYQPK